MSSSTNTTTKRITFALGFILPVVQVTIAFAQSPPAGGGAAPAGGGTAGGGTTTGGTGAPTGVTVTPGTTTTTYFPGGVAPTPPGQTLGGGNTQYSSSKPITGSETDTFDFKSGGRGVGSVHGSEGSSFVLGGSTTGGGYSGVIPDIHNVRRGDTLWGICGFYFHNPYQWPRVWSYNAQIQNPHWIYPGDQVKLKSGSGDQPRQAVGKTFTDRRRQVPTDTVFLRNVGFIEDDQSNWGELNGAREDKMFLSDFDEVYLRISSTHEVKEGQELTVYRPIRNVGGGRLIQIQGTVKVDQWNAKDKIARAKITETLDTIERGASVGPIVRRFEVVPPARNETDVEATILTSITPHDLYGQNQIVFIDKGEEDGLKPGNRLFIIRKGDGFHRTQPSHSAAKRIALEDESPAATEQIPGPRDDETLPEEVLAEVRVISPKKHSAMVLVTTSRKEIEIGDKAFARKGY